MLILQGPDFKKNECLGEREWTGFTWGWNLDCRPEWNADIRTYVTNAMTANRTNSNEMMAGKRLASVRGM